MSTEPGPSPLPSELPCGRRVDELLEQVAQGRGGQRDAHQADCPHCQATLVELGRLWAPVSRDAAAPLSPPEGLVAAVMQGVRRSVADVWYTFELADGGAIRVATRVVAVIARDAARRVPGVRAALGRSTAIRLAQLVERSTLRHQHPHSAVGVLGRTAVVDVALAVEYGPAMQQLAQQVQAEVGRALREGIGLEMVTVNVTVDDVYVGE
jgi:uncharacterized alkaline shock family protein YloU